MFPPDPKLYPDYDRGWSRAWSGRRPVTSREVFGKNLPLREFIASDWTMLNSRLAMHYRMPA